MDKEEFTRFIQKVYNMGRIDGEMLADDTPWIQEHMADYPIEDFYKIKSEW